MGAEAHGERGARGYNEGLEAEPPAGSRGRAPGQGVRGRSPLKLRALSCVYVPRFRQISPFLMFGVTIIWTFLLSPTSNLQLQEHDIQNSSVKKTYSRLRWGGTATSFGGKPPKPKPSYVPAATLTNAGGGYIPSSSLGSAPGCDLLSLTL